MSFNMRSARLSRDETAVWNRFINCIGDDKINNYILARVGLGKVMWYHQADHIGTLSLRDWTVSERNNKLSLVFSSNTSARDSPRSLMEPVGHFYCVDCRPNGEYIGRNGDRYRLSHNPQVYDSYQNYQWVMQPHTTCQTFALYQTLFMSHNYFEGGYQSHFPDFRLGAYEDYRHGTVDAQRADPRRYVNNLKIAIRFWLNDLTVNPRFAVTLKTKILNSWFRADGRKMSVADASTEFEGLKTLMNNYPNRSVSFCRRLLGITVHEYEVQQVAHTVDIVSDSSDDEG